MNLVIINRCFLIKIILPIIFLYLWELKMCRLALQLLSMLGNVLGCPQHALQRPRHACNILGMLATSSVVLVMFQQCPRSPISKRNLPTCCLISCEVKGVVYHQTSIEDVASMPRTLQSMPMTFEDVAKHT